MFALKFCEKFCPLLLLILTEVIMDRRVCGFKGRTRRPLACHQNKISTPDTQWATVARGLTWNF